MLTGQTPHAKLIVACKTAFDVEVGGGGDLLRIPFQKVSSSVVATDGCAV